MKSKLIRLGAMVAVVFSAWLGCGRTHKYLIVYQKQDDWNGSTQISQLIATAPKFTAAEVWWAQTNVQAGVTNRAVVILNVVRLDD